MEILEYFARHSRSIPTCHNRFHKSKYMACLFLNMLSYFGEGNDVQSEIISSLNNVNASVAKTFAECCAAVFQEEKNFLFEPLLFQIESVLDFLHDELNTGHWKEVPLNTRRAFSSASVVKALILTKKPDGDRSETIAEALQCIDRGLLLGAPLNLNPTLLTCTATHYSSLLKESNISTASDTSLKRCADCETYQNLKAAPIDTISCPSLEHFYKNYFVKQIPVKLQDCISHWPAITKWADLNYLLGVAGKRTVPIEIGANYTDSSWTQKLMTFQDFIKNFYLEKSELSSVGYLAQHNLFDQIPELKEDIRIPDYCSLSRGEEEVEEPDVNAWFGPEGTVSPLHYDPKNNLLTQIFGTKQIILFSAADSGCLYPHTNRMVFNTAQVDPLKPDLFTYPAYAKAKPYKCLLKEGEILYIPPKWWHHVSALEKSFSVSFWWQ